MKIGSILLLLSIVFLFTLEAQNLTKKNPTIEQILREISSTNIRRNVERLVSFKTRHTLSDTSSGSLGIGAYFN